MHLLRIIMLSIFLSSCAVLEKRETFVACRVADATLTIIALEKGFVEMNPLMNSVLSHGYLPFLIVQGLAAYFVWKYWNDLGQGTKVAVNTLGCLPAVNNAVVLLQ